LASLGRGASRLHDRRPRTLRRKTWHPEKVPKKPDFAMTYYNFADFPAPRIAAY